MDKRIRLTQELSPANLRRRNSINTKLLSDFANTSEKPIARAPSNWRSINATVLASVLSSVLLATREQISILS